MYLKKAFSEFKLKKYLQSLSTLENVTNTSHREKNKFKLLHLKGMVLYNLKKYNDAVSSFEQCIELKPNDANLYYHKGLSLFFTKKYKEALECFTKAYGLDNTLQNSLYYKGKCNMKLGNNQEAIDIYSKVISGNTYNSDILLSLGNCFFNEKKYKQDIGYYNIYSFWKFILI